MPEGRNRLGAFLLAVSIVAVSSLSSGCGTRVMTLYEKVMGSQRYAHTTESFTRTKEVHDGLETRFIFSSTWLSPEWVRAFSEEYANIYYLDEERREKVIGRWREESETYERFFVALFTPDDRTNDLDEEETLWTLRLVRADEIDFRPVYVRKTGLRPEEVSRFFPYSGTWYRAYEVAFPKEAGAKVEAKAGSPRYKLVLSGVQGRAVLVWN
ncbi:MAG TPA: hypothetical protein VFU42_00505 [Candidatus Deferrimicrobiaceae bacterium]|nr:hypothetical protein [Candidatus Deferrimicrobiaceae bacterium]